jgi:hypothetical protein
MLARRRRLVLPVLLCSLAALLVAATAAGAAGTPKTETASAGAVTAAFSYTDAGDGKWEDMKLTVTRAGVTAFDAPPAVEGCEAPYCAPGGAAADGSSVRVADLDGDGEPEVVIGVYTGGAHCCTVAEVLRWNGSGYTATTRDFADYGFVIDDHGIFVTGDQRFAYAFASFADSPFPVRLLTYAAGTWKDVTAKHPETLRTEAARLRKDYMKRRNGTRALGLLAAWAADEYRLGHQRQVKAFLASELRAGRLKGDRLCPRGKPYISVLERRLKAWGYTR